MSEWLKTILSVGVGVTLGLISAFVLEPMKIRHLRRLDARRAEASLYDELGRALTIFRVFSSQEEKHCWPLVQKLKFEKFDYYFTISTSGARCFTKYPRMLAFGVYTVNLS